jgi:hypothetical protein
VLLIGDSLEVGSAPYLRQALGGVPLEVDADGGRTSSQGLAVLAERLRPEHRVVAFPLGTNDLSADVLPLVAAFRDVRTAATKAEPEPVLGAPR